MSAHCLVHIGLPPSVAALMRNFAVILFVALAVVATSSQASEPLSSVPSVDLQRYVGTWYEQARMPMFFQRKCAANTTATYTLQSDGLIKVHNRCDTNEGSQIDAVGVAKSVPGSTSRLKVSFAPKAISFLPFVWADYWVIDLDPSYRWAVVGEPEKKYLWVLSRDKSLPQAELTAIVERARLKGFRVERLLYTQQK